MDVRASMRPSRPQTVKELVTQAESFTFNTNIPVKHWTRAAETLYQEASFAIADGDYGRAYMMLYRHSLLILEYIPKHPQLKDPENRKAFKPLSRRINRVIQELEQLKPEIENAVKEWERMAPAVKDSNETTTSPSRYAEFAARDPSLTGNARILDASEHQDLAVDLAQKELTRRDTARRATRQAGIPEEETLVRRRGGRWDQWEGNGRPGEDDDLRRQMEATRQALDSAREGRHGDRDSRPVTVSQNYQYPSISKSRPVQFDSAPPHIPASPASQPARPPKEPLALPPRPDVGAVAPNVPQKVPLPEYQPLIPQYQPALTYTDGPALPPKESITAPALPKKERLTFKPGAYLENGDPIRSVFLPRKLRQKFLDIAAENTRKGLEMCGILCGTPVNNALFIRCLLIPDQKCTSDTCETENEGSMFDYCMNEDLLVLGWIHTHPTQTCFMSSRDLHTQAGYQVMMPESVAIVCAPKFTPSWGIFRLTNPPGLDHILNCNHKDTFHQHAIDNIYREAEQPSGHVYESDKLDFYVHDLRTK
ncbi:Fc.00g026020.m01.CDS01 [Cosmosporella sp. VM-42]